MFSKGDLCVCTVEKHTGLLYQENKELFDHDASLRYEGKQNDVYIVIGYMNYPDYAIVCLSPDGYRVVFDHALLKLVNHING